MSSRLLTTGGMIALVSQVVVLALAPGPTAIAQPIAPGEAIAHRNCSQCHAMGADETSSNPAAPPLRDLRDLAEIERLIGALRQGLLVRHPAMPEMRLTPREIEHLGAYIRAIQTKKDVQFSPAVR